MFSKKQETIEKLEKENIDLIQRVAHLEEQNETFTKRFELLASVMKKEEDRQNKLCKEIIKAMVDINNIEYSTNGVFHDFLIKTFTVSIGKNKAEIISNTLFTKNELLSTRVYYNDEELVSSEVKKVINVCNELYKDGVPKKIARSQDGTLTIQEKKLKKGKNNDKK